MAVDGLELALTGGLEDGGGEVGVGQVEVLASEGREGVGLGRAALQPALVGGFLRGRGLGLGLRIALEAVVAESDLVVDLGLPIAGLGGRSMLEMVLGRQEHRLIPSDFSVHASK